MYKLYYIVTLLSFLGTDLSLFESKVVGGVRLGFHGKLPYMVTILYNMREVDYPPYAMGSFYDGKHVIIASINAKTIKENISNFLVQGGEKVSCEMFGITDVKFKTNENNEIASKYAILEVSYKTQIDFIILYHGLGAMSYLFRN